MYTLHESNAKKIKLPGRMVIPMVGTQGIPSKHMSFGVAVLPPLSKMDPHSHKDEEEIIYIISGFGKVYFGNGTAEKLKPGTVIIAPRDMDHYIENKSKYSMKWCWVFDKLITIGKHTKVSE